MFSFFFASFAFIRILALCYLSFFLWSCSNNDLQESGINKMESDSSAKVCLIPDSINPNGTSELAILMRQMTDHAEKIKIKIEQGEPLDSFPQSQRKIHAAVPTDSAVHTTVFSSLATHYLSSLEQLYASSEAGRTNTYNTLVNSCIACHNEFCKGPVKRIKKMFIFQKEK